MKEFFEKLFKTYPPIIESFQGDVISLWMNVIGNSLICVTFVIIGFLCFRLARIVAPQEARNHRIRMTRLVGSFILGCGISRGVHVICYWHNMANIDALVQFYVGAVALATLATVPNYITNVKSTITTLDEAKEMMVETSKRVDALKDISEQIKKGN